MLPNFLCIGAQKAGTTTLWHILNQHPDIYLADNPRETKFFTHDRFYARGSAYYELFHFASWNGQKAAGEKTPEYLFAQEVPERISRTLGNDVRFIVSLRSPAQRAYSQFRHNYQGLCEYLDFNQAIETESGRITQSESYRMLYGYLARGYYAQQIKNYLDIFPKENFLFLIFENDLVQNQQDTARKLFRFLEVEEEIDLQLPVKSGQPELSKVNYTDSETTMEVQIKLPVNAGERITGRIRKFYDWLCEKLKNQSGQKNELSQSEIKVPANSVVMMTPWQTEAGIEPQIIHNPSADLIKFAELNEKNRPYLSSLTTEQEHEMNNRYFRDDIMQLELMLDLDLKHWLEPENN